MLNQLDSDLWECAQPLRFIGTEVGCRMTCVRLENGHLLLHSPIAATDDLLDSIAALGEVRWLVAPNALHHLFIQDWRTRFPAADTLIAPKLRRKRTDLADATDLTEPPEDWTNEVDVVRVNGIPFIDEFVFFHRSSATLIATDLAFNLGRESPFLTRCFIRLTGRFGELAPTMVERLMVRDRSALRSSLEAILQWPFERVVVSHGKVLETGGREALAKGFDWLSPS